MNSGQPTISNTPQYAFVFVCQAGELEIKALLLAASLKRHLCCEYELIAAVPTPAHIWGEVASATREQLLAFGATLLPIVNPIDPGYPIGNKLACIDVPTRARKIVFLDSDILCLRDLGAPPGLTPSFAAKPADLRTFAADAEVWRPLYAAANVAMPSLRLPTTVSGEFGPPYFNSGVVAVDSGLQFGSHWIDCARTLLQLPSMHEQRHWLDQVSLPIAMQRLGLTYAALDERFNFPAHLKPLPAEPPIFCHYHWPRIIHREPTLHRLVRDLAQQHPLIAAAIAAHGEWAGLLERAPARSPAAASAAAVCAETGDLIITGIAHSGGKELLRHLRGRSDAVVIDAAADSVTALKQEHSPWAAAIQLRQAQANSPADDAAATTRSAPAARAIIFAAPEDPGFLCRLDALKRVAPTARLVVCVRDPFATIAAWARRPLAELDAAIAQAQDIAERWLARDEVCALRNLAALDDPSERRALWWWWQAQRILDQKHAITLVRYEDWCADPARVMQTLFGTTMGSEAVARANDPEDHGSALGARDLQAIRAVCLQVAADLGLSS